MLTKAGPKIIEINARFGDPENMNVLPLLKTDFIDICQAMVNGEISQFPINFNQLSTVCKYVVPEGYGVKSVVDKPIIVDEQAIQQTGAELFYASVNKQDSTVHTTSSRSLAIVGIAETLKDAEKICERGLSHVQGDHIFMRHDIGTTSLIQKRIDHMNQLRRKP
jgi:phosphoribosylamine--glycine ligase